MVLVPIVAYTLGIPVFTPKNISIVGFYAFIQLLLGYVFLKFGFSHKLGVGVGLVVSIILYVLFGHRLLDA